MTMNKKIKLESVSAVIEALRHELPGHRKMDAARFLNVGKGMVSNMLKDQKIPLNHHHIIAKFLEARGYRIDEEEVFGYSTETLIERAFRSGLEMNEPIVIDIAPATRRAGGATPF